MLCFFFFSSRRRHTRYWRDWSSDVCSSDLASLFTNAVEILGGRLNLGQGAVGSVLAAVGTALPETMIPIVAVLAVVLVGGDREVASEIGIGAILGAPFMLVSLAMFVVGASALVFRRHREQGTEIRCREVS